MKILKIDGKSLKHFHRGFGQLVAVDKQIVLFAVLAGKIDDGIVFINGAAGFVRKYDNLWPFAAYRGGTEFFDKRNPRKNSDIAYMVKGLMHQLIIRVKNAGLPLLPALITEAKSILTMIGYIYCCIQVLTILYF